MLLKQVGVRLLPTHKFWPPLMMCPILFPGRNFARIVFLHLRRMETICMLSGRTGVAAMRTLFTSAQLTAELAGRVRRRLTAANLISFSHGLAQIMVKFL